MRVFKLMRLGLVFTFVFYYFYSTLLYRTPHSRGKEDAKTIIDDFILARLGL